MYMCIISTVQATRFLSTRCAEFCRSNGNCDTVQTMTVRPIRPQEIFSDSPLLPVPCS